MAASVAALALANSINLAETAAAGSWLIKALAAAPALALSVAASAAQQPRKQSGV